MAATMRIRIESRESIHFGINFLFAPAPVIGQTKVIELQRNLAARGVDFSTVNRTEKAIELGRTDGPLSLLIAIHAPQVGQLLVRSPSPQRPLDLFQKEAESVCQAYADTWQRPAQFLTRDAAIHCLYPCENCDHAFKYIWEHLLGQSASYAAHLGRPLAGGGLRFVMPPTRDEKPEPTVVEVKIESFLRDPSKLYVDTHLSWPAPSNENMFAMCGELLKRVESYIEEKVIAFLTHER
jgi:hypothetical protein